ncbi:MAG: hypothetical protein Q4E44_09900 [bacterium]|nr:hypothetical protein [bacterium]
MESKIITHRAWLRSMFAFALVMASCHTLWAQNVVVSPTTGKFVAALTYSGEVGFERGWSSLWRHEQLQLSLSVSDDKGLDAGGEFTNPAGNLLRKDDTSFYISGGSATDSQIILSLPKGYRITSYEIVLLNENNGKTVGELDYGRITKSFRETDSGFSQTKALAKSASGNSQMSSDNENTEYVIKRTSTGKGDMGDHLYFQIKKGEGKAFYALTVKSFEVHFAADNDFTTSITPSATISKAVSVSKAEFNVGIADLGPIKPQTKNGKTYYAYSYENVKPLKAAFTLFQKDAVKDGLATEGVAKQNKITAVNLGVLWNSDYYYSLKSGTYYIESPTSMISQNNISLPIGYRITGAKLICRKKRNGTNFTLRLYNADGESYTDHQVTSTDDQSFTVSGLNNDAVKFEVIGSGDALIKYDITMQALSPYIKNMDIVCHDQNNNTITNTYTTNNFSVRGGKFVFYVPEESQGKWRITFENLRSDYADNTYYDNTGIGNSRYSFVKSPYWDTALHLYNSDPNHTYADKVKLEVTGDKAFRFNNADELDNNSTSTETRYWTEYPFSINSYLKNGSKFGECYIDEGKTGEAYIFTADETRYNIAPTTATEHRYYAFYKMEVEVKKKTYQPVVELKKIYDRTCYEGDVEYAQYGAKVTTEKLADGTMGYLTATQIKDAVTNELQKLGAKPEHLLYVDASALHSVYQPNALNALQNAIGKNALIYLPRFTTYNGNNCATKTLAGSFISCGNIIFTDKHPFYAPYDIDVNAANYASYERKITVVNAVEYGKSVNATIMLPFTLKLDDNGIHYNRDYNGNLINDVSFSVKTLQSEKCMEYTDSPYGNRIDYAENYAHFVPFTGEVTKPNAPYMVHVEEAPDDPTCLFSAIQYGAEIKATEGMNATNYTYSGDDATGTLDDVECTFTPLATYAGSKLNKTGNYFYFAKNWFLCSQNIVSSNYLYVHPFRAFFEYTGTTQARRFGIIFGENTGGSTAIETAAQTTTPNGLSVSTLNGGLEISASVTTVVRINNICGEAVANVAIKGGETKSVHLPSGIYVVEGKKVVVK